MTKPHGWHLERSVKALDTAGQPVEVTSGVIRFETGIVVAAFRLDDGPAVILEVASIANLRANLEHSLLDVRNMERGVNGS